jgi:hypothetical protein
VADGERGDSRGRGVEGDHSESIGWRQCVEHSLHPLARILDLGLPPNPIVHAAGLIEDHDQRELGRSRSRTRAHVYRQQRADAGSGDDRGIEGRSVPEHEQSASTRFDMLCERRSLLRIQNVGPDVVENHRIVRRHR